MLTEKLNVETKDRELILTRDFDAPPELMFEMWSDCKHLKHWWGPKEWPMDECKMDFRVGGEWLYRLRGPNPEDESWGKGIYREIDKPRMIKYDDYFADKDGNINENMPGMIITVEFHPHEGKTRLHSSSIFATREGLEQVMQMGVVEGMSSTMDRLDEYLSRRK